MKRNIAEEKSKSFAVSIVEAYNHLRNDRREFVMSNQLLKSGTSIGANIKEAIYAQSRSDFKTKVYIALKEAGETEYWLELLHLSGYLNEEEYNRLAEPCKELIRMLDATTRTLNKNEN